MIACTIRFSDCLCYGQESVEDSGDYLKKCGQSFWSFVSGDNDFYITIIEPLVYKAKERNEAFQIEYGKLFKFLQKHLPLIALAGIVQFSSWPFQRG